tara:strand:- start:299 stop:469 length:171 start_codon:yes stop_codon:yes gene_type:complete
MALRYLWDGVVYVLTTMILLIRIQTAAAGRIPIIHYFKITRFTAVAGTVTIIIPSF